MKYLLTIEGFSSRLFFNKGKKVFNQETVSDEMNAAISNYVYTAYKMYAFVTQEDTVTKIISKLNSIVYTYRLDNIDDNMVCIDINNDKFNIPYKKMVSFLEQKIREIIPTLTENKKPH